MKRVGVDVGGTFTDLVYADDESGRRVVHKVLSTPGQNAISVVAGIEELVGQAGERMADLDLIFHATTLATNMLLERKGAHVGMITTRGFRDVIHIARKKRPLNFSNRQDLPWQSHPLVRRRNRFPVTERISVHGEVLVGLDEDEVLAATRTLVERGVDAIAVCFLGAFANPAHERRARELVATVAPDVPVWLSHEVSSRYREYERFSTACISSFVGPAVDTYLGGLDATLSTRGVDAPVHLMASGGGALTLRAARRRPAELVMSGPVAGVIAGIEAGRVVGANSIITIDVGGTSADIGVAPDGVLRYKHLLDTSVAGYDMMVPMVDIETIGAGGGSIARVDDEGMFRVGPESAGADPGPVSYGNGGIEPTVTDALVVLGWLAPDAFLGGRMRLDVAAARAAIGRLAESLRMDVQETALGILRIALHHMVNAIELHSVRKGYDPRQAVLVALGGAGPTLAAHIAARIGIPRVVVPPSPGIGSAIGLLSSDLRYERSATVWERAEPDSNARLERVFRSLTDAALAEFARDGLSADSVQIERHLECRYVGQGYELRVPAPAGACDVAWMEEVVETFHAAHERERTRRMPGLGVQIVNVGVTAVGVLARVPTDGLDEEYAAEPTPTTYCEAIFESGGAPVTGPVPRFARAALGARARLVGPCILDQLDTTVVVPPEWRAQALTSAHVVLERTPEPTTAEMSDGDHDV